MITKPKTSTLNLLYVRIMRAFLWLTGAWPGEALGEKVPFAISYHKKHIPVQASIFFGAEIWYLVKYHSSLDFFTMSHIYITGFLHIVFMVRAALPLFKSYGLITRTFFLEFHLLNHANKGKYCKIITEKIEILSHYFTIYLMTVMVCGIVLFNYMPIYNSYKNGAFSGNRPDNVTVELAIYYYFPGFDCKDHIYVSIIYNLYTSYTCSALVCCIDLLLFLMVFHIIGHILILKHRMDNVHRPKTSIKINEQKLMKKRIPFLVKLEIFDGEENKILRNELIEMMNHHKYIVRFAKDMSNFFGPMLAITYLYHMICGCLLLIVCSRADIRALAQYGPLTFILFGQLIQISVIFEVVLYVSEKLVDAVYCLPWESMNVDNQRIVRFWLNRIQEPIQVSAVGMVPVGVQTMQAVLKTTLSYFAFLRSTQE